MSKFILVHFEEVLKGFHANKYERFERGWTKHSILDPSVFAYLAKIGNVSDLKCLQDIIQEANDTFPLVSTKNVLK